MKRQETPTRNSQGEDFATSKEVEAAIVSLSVADNLRLLRFAQRRIATIGRASMGRDEKVLLQEAVTSALAGNRRWNKGAVDFLGFLFGAIRSISSNWCKNLDPNEAYLASELVEESDEGSLLNPLLSFPANTPDPEQSVILKEKEDLRMQQVARIKDLVERRPLASLIIEGQLEGLNGPQIQEMLGVSKKEYETEMKWIYRTVRDDAAKGGSHVWTK